MRVGLIFETIIFGALLELVFAYIWVAASNETSAVTHLSQVYQSNLQYLDMGGFSNSVVLTFFETYLITPVYQAGISIANFFKSHQEFRLISHYTSIIFVTMSYALSVFLQKLFIAAISLPLFFAFLIVGLYDGIVHRELRRYRAGVESSKRAHELFPKITKWLSRFAFVGYVSIPFHILAPVWFFGFGITTAACVQIRTSFIEKYI